MPRRKSIQASITDMIKHEMIDHDIRTKKDLAEDAQVSYCTLKAMFRGDMEWSLPVLRRLHRIFRFTQEQWEIIGVGK